MCYHLSHHCKYCGDEYLCEDEPYVCSTINGDEDANMCPSCKRKLEDRLRALGNRIKMRNISIEEIMK